MECLGYNVIKNAKPRNVDYEKDDMVEIGDREAWVKSS
jgi:hypothetical protein